MAEIRYFKGRECEDCGDRCYCQRTRCRRCRKLLCPWCFHHVHSLTREEAPDA